MTTVDELFARLCELKGKEYEVYKAGLPEDACNAAIEICELFERSSEAVRRKIISKVGADNSFLLVALVNLMAVSAVRKTDQKLVIRGLVCAGNRRRGC